METLSTKSPEANDSGQPSTDWEEVAAMTGTQPSTDWEEVAAMADTQIKQTETKAQSAQDDPEIKNKNEESAENDIKMKEELGEDEYSNERSKLGKDIANFILDNNLIQDWEILHTSPLRYAFNQDPKARFNNVSKTIIYDLVDGKGYKDIKNLVKIAKMSRKELSNSPEKQEELANFITRMIALDANHGASPLQRIKHKISKKQLYYDINICFEKGLVI